MRARDTNQEAATDPAGIALGALVWTLGDASRADRLLAVTGLSPAGLRAGADSPAVLAAVIVFLEQHEPDLVACADALGIMPTILVDARRTLESQ